MLGTICSPFNIAAAAATEAAASSSPLNEPDDTKRCVGGVVDQGEEL